MKNNFYNFKNTDELVESFSKTIIEKLKKAIEKKGSGVILLSGGNTPKPLFKKLKTFDIEWEKVKVGLVDERWVPQTHKDSNAKLVKDYFLQDKAKKAQFIPMYQRDIEPLDAQEKCSKLMKSEFFPCDVLILGMGDDAHTASLFPNNEKLSEGLNKNNESYCMSMVPQSADHTRMSLTLSAILKAENVYLHIQGKNKKDVYDYALESNDYLSSPISAVLNSNKNIEVYYNE